LDSLDAHTVDGVSLDSALEVLLAALAGKSNVCYVASVIGGSDEWVIAFGGEETTQLAYDATSLNVEEAIEGLTCVEAGDVTVEGNQGGPFTITFAASRPKAIDPISARGFGACSVEIVTKIEFKQRDGSTNKITVTYAEPEKERTGSTIDN